MYLAEGANDLTVHNDVAALAGMQIRRARANQAIFRHLHSLQEALYNALHIVKIHIFLGIAPAQGLATTA